MRFLLPEGGLSAIDVRGEPFHDHVADRALFEAISGGLALAIANRFGKLAQV